MFLVRCLIWRAPLKKDRERSAKRTPIFRGADRTAERRLVIALPVWLLTGFLVPLLHLDRRLHAKACL